MRRPWWTKLIPAHIRNPRSCSAHTSTVPHTSERTCGQTKPERREHFKRSHGTRSIPLVIAKTQGPYQNKSEQIVPLYPESFVPYSGSWLSESLADRAPGPSYASALAVFVILDKHSPSLFHRPNREGERKRITPRPTPVVPSAVNTSHRLHPRLATSIQRSDCRLLYDCLVLFSQPGFFSALKALIRPPCLGQQSHCLFKWKRQWISESLSIFPLY